MNYIALGITVAVGVYTGLKAYNDPQYITNAIKDIFWFIVLVLCAVVIYYLIYFLGDYLIDVIKHKKSFNWWWIAGILVFSKLYEFVNKRKK